jgi:hypothetical protein
MAVPTRICSEAIERVLTAVPGFEIIGSVVVAQEPMPFIVEMSDGSAGQAAA